MLALIYVIKHYAKTSAALMLCFTPTDILIT